MKKKSTVGIDKIEFILKASKIDYVKEYLPIKGRKFRSDFFIPSLNTIIEFEGINSAKSRHTSITGYSKDCEKYNLISMSGYTILRYTILNVVDLINDIELIRDLQSAK